MNNIKLLICILGILLAIILPACIASRELVLVVLFDLSGSTINDREYYYNDFKEKILLQKIDTDDTVIIAIGIITDNSMKEHPIANETLIGMESPFARRGKVEKILNKVKGHLLNNEAIQSQLTDILGAMYVTPNDVFNAYKDDNNKKVLVVFSDMIHEYNDCNFKKESLTSNRIEEIISNKRNNGGLPSLDKVKVYVAGATGQPNIKNFWDKYFKSCGAVLEYYGRTLIKFKE